MRVHPHQRCSECACEMRGRLRRDDQIATADIDLILKSERDGERGLRLGKISIEGDDGANTGDTARWQNHNGIAGTNTARCDLTCKATKVLIGADDPLDCEA